MCCRPTQTLSHVQHINLQPRKRAVNQVHRSMRPRRCSSAVTEHGYALQMVTGCPVAAYCAPGPMLLSFSGCERCHCLRPCRVSAHLSGHPTSARPCANMRMLTMYITKYMQFKLQHWSSMFAV